MPELFSTRDCVTLVKGDCFTVTVSEAMAAGGWAGGQGVQWLASPAKDEFLVDYSDGFYAGFCLAGDSEASDEFTASTRNQPFYRFATIGAGGWHILTTSFERYTWTSRQSGPLVEITYNASDRLLFSLRGRWTNESEWDLSGDIRAPNTFFIGFVTQIPSAMTNGYLGVQTSI